MAASRVMTLGIESEFLDQLRAVAKIERRSVSAQMLFLRRGSRRRYGDGESPCHGLLALAVGRSETS
jgi:hypothetical protein